MHNPSCFLSQIEDPRCIYIIGRWKSSAQQMKESIRSSANQELLDLLKDQVAMEWVFHVNIRHDLPQLKACVTSVGQYFIKTG